MPHAPKVTMGFAPLRAVRGGIALLAACLLLPGSASAIYKWVDGQGHMHFAQDLHQIPDEYVAQAEANAAKPASPSPIQVYSAPSQASPSKTHSGGSSRNPAGGAGAKGTFKIPVTQVGSSMRVTVRINDSVNAPFLIDTGASDVAIPRWVVEAAGIDLTGARTGRYSTANGVIEIPLLTLDSVDLGGARVENVSAAVSDTMETGLLGLSYFNHFQYSIDPGAGIVTLVANGLEESGRIRGGRSKPQWHQEFGELNARRAALERKLDATLPSHGRGRRMLEAELAEVERQYALLEGEADDAKVPFDWRD